VSFAHSTAAKRGMDVGMRTSACRRTFPRDDKDDDEFIAVVAIGSQEDDNRTRRRAFRHHARRENRRNVVDWHSRAQWWCARHQPFSLSLSLSLSPFVDRRCGRTLRSGQPDDSRIIPSARHQISPLDLARGSRKRDREIERAARLATPPLRHQRGGA